MTSITSAAATISGSIPDDTKSRSTTAAPESSLVATTRTVARRRAASCSVAAMTRPPRGWRSRTSASASASPVTPTTRSASRVKRGSARTDTASPPIKAQRRPSAGRSATMRRRSASAVLRAGAARRSGDPRYRRVRPPGGYSTTPRAGPRSRHPWPPDVPGEAGRGAWTRPARRDRGRSGDAARGLRESRPPRGYCRWPPATGPSARFGRVRAEAGRGGGGDGGTRDHLR